VRRAAARDASWLAAKEYVSDEQTAFKAPYAQAWKLHGGAVAGFQQCMHTAMVQGARR